MPDPTVDGCTCGWGGVHDPDNPRCEVNQSRENGDRSAIEQLADEWEVKHAEREAKTSGIETWFRVAASDLRAAIEADRAAGWLNPGEARDLATAYQSEARILSEEIERLKDETPTVEIKQGLSQPATCSVTYKGQVFFDGVSRNALVEREAEVGRLRAALRSARDGRDGIAVRRAERAEATLAEVRALADEWESDSPITSPWYVADLRAVLDNKQEAEK